MVVTAISSSDLVVSCHALAELDMVLRDEKWYLLMSHVNQILMLIIIQLRQVYTRYFNDPSVSADELRTLIRCHLATVESLFRRSTLAREASRDSLRELIQSLFNLMLDERLTEQVDGENVIRAINSLSVCIIHAANPTRMLSSLIHLLHDSVTNGHFNNRFTQAVLKSIWRITKGMDAIINTFSLDVILFDCHHFLKAFPSPSWKTRKSDVPLRTIKTLLHVICRLQGSAVLDYVNQIPNKDDSELEAYIIRTLKATAGIQVVPSSGGANSSDQTKPSVNGVPSEQKKMFQPSAATRDKLTGIFRKIASKQPDESAQGVNELYEFTQLYPELDVTPHLEQCSQIFQSFIKQALKNIGTERSRRANIPTTASGDFSANAVLNNSVNGLADGLDSLARSYDLSDTHRVNPKVFMSRLAMLRRQLGIGGVSTTSNMEDSPGGLLGPVAGDDEAAGGLADRATGESRLQATLRNLVKPDTGAGRNGEDGQAEANRPGGLTADELTDIRRRLDRIRHGQTTT